MGRIVKQEILDANKEANNMANLSSALMNLAKSADDFKNRCNVTASGADVNYVLEKLEILTNWAGGIRETSRALLSLSEAAANANNLILENWPIADATEISDKNITELQDEIDRINNDIANYNSTISWYESLKWYNLKKVFNWTAYNNAKNSKSNAEASLNAVIDTKTKVEKFFETCENVASNFISATSNIGINK